MPLTTALPVFRTGLRLPVSSRLSRRHRGPAHFRGILTAHELSEFRGRANLPAIAPRPRAGAASQPPAPRSRAPPATEVTDAAGRMAPGAKERPATPRSSGAEVRPAATCRRGVGAGPDRLGRRNAGRRNAVRRGAGAVDRDAVCPNAAGLNAGHRDAAGLIAADRGAGPGGAAWPGGGCEGPESRPRHAGVPRWRVMPTGSPG